MERLVTVTGVGRISVKPNTIILNFPLERIDEVYADSIDALNADVSTLKEIIAKNSLSKEDVKTLDYRINRKSTWNEETKEYDFVGYAASHDIEIEFAFDLELLNSMISEISSRLEGVRLSVSFGVTESEKHNRDLIDKAVADAMKTGMSLAHAADIDLGYIQSIVCAFDEVRFRSETFSDSDYSGELRSAMIDVNPANIMAEKNVTITWEIEPH